MQPSLSIESFLPYLNDSIETSLQKELYSFRESVMAIKNLYNYYGLTNPKILEYDSPMQAIENIADWKPYAISYKLRYGMGLSISVDYSL